MAQATTGWPVICLASCPGEHILSSLEMLNDGRHPLESPQHSRRHLSPRFLFFILVQTCVSWQSPLTRWYSRELSESEQSNATLTTNTYHPILKICRILSYFWAWSETKLARI